MSNELNKYQQDVAFPRRAVTDDDIDLRELFSIIWQGKWLIIAISALFAIGSVFFALSQPNIYKSEALLAPADAEQGGGGFAALAGQFGGLASMAGINLGGKKAGVDKVQLAIEVMKSRQFSSEFIQKHDLLADLMAAKSWDMTTNTMIYDTELFDVKTKTWLGDPEDPLNPEPSMQEAFKVFSSVMRINSEKDTSMVTIAIEHVSPHVAQQWVTWLIEDINKVMKERDVAEATRSTEFLYKQIAITTIVDISSMLYKLVEEQAKTIMFAEVRDEYVFKTIDPAIVPEENVKPSRALICLLGTILGGILGVMFVLIRYFFKKEHKKRT